MVICRLGFFSTLIPNDPNYRHTESGKNQQIECFEKLPDDRIVLPQRIKKVKSDGDADLKVIGSGNLCQTLFKHDLVDEMLLMTYPVTLGSGKRLFGDGTVAAAFEMTDSLVTKNGVIFASYKRAGEVKTGHVGPV